MADHRRGLVLGVAAYGMWGLFPLYWPLLKPAGAVEILGHRIAWSALAMLLLVAALRRTDQLRALLQNGRARTLLTGAALVITLNWGTYIWGVNHGHVVDTSLGYYINPLVTVLMGVLILKETLRPLQWAAMGVAAIAVLVLTIDHGRPPWVALVLAFSFGTYGLLKKTAGAGAVESLTLETLVLAPFAVTFLLVLSARGDDHFTGYGAAHILLLAGTGIITAVPLICFGGAATRLPLTTLGLLQYLAPTLQFAIGVLLLHEPMGMLRLLGFALVWAGLAAYTVDAVHHRRRAVRLAVPEPV